MNKVALVFGGTGGIGRAICYGLKNKGMTVYSTSHKRISKNPYILHCDVTKNKTIESVVSQILKKESRIDLVINSVTPQLKLKTIESLSLREFKEDIEAILIGGININKAVIPIMKVNHGGIMINILSSLVLGDVSARMSSYISAKYGLAGFTKCLALELKKFNIFVFGISPSFVETDLIKVFPEKFIEIEKNKRKDKKLINPAEVARVILNLVKNPQKYRTGDNIEIN